MLHEIGHALGYPTGAAQGTSAETLMSEFLTLGVRRTPGVATPAPVPSDFLADEAHAAPLLGYARLASFDYTPLALGQTTTDRAGAVGVEDRPTADATVESFGSEYDIVNLPSSFEFDTEAANLSEIPAAVRTARLKRSSALVPDRIAVDERSTCRT